MLVLTRQNLPVLVGTNEFAEEGINKGAYIISEAKGEIDGIIIATGSEVALALESQKELEKEEIYVRVVSMPSQNIFDEQSLDYKEKILPTAIKKRMVIEAASSFGWGKYIGMNGKTLTIDTWGLSGAGELLFEKYGFSVDTAIKIYKSIHI